MESSQSFVNLQLHFPLPATTLYSPTQSTGPPGSLAFGLGSEFLTLQHSGLKCKGTVFIKP